MAEDTKPAVTAPWLAAAQTAPSAEAGAAAPSVATDTQTTPPAAPDDPSTVVLAAAIAATVPADAAPSAELVDDVIVTVPKAFQLRLDNFTLKSFAAGVQRMERSVATHWYAIAHGVTVFNDSKE